MAVPKKKTSKARRDSRKANWLRVTAPSLSECSHCHEMKPNHRVCPNCGYYDGEEVIKTEEAK